MIRHRTLYVALAIGQLTIPACGEGDSKTDHDAGDGEDASSTGDDDAGGEPRVRDGALERAPHASSGRFRSRRPIFAAGAQGDLHIASSPRLRGLVQRRFPKPLASLELACASALWGKRYSPSCEVANPLLFRLCPRPGS
jgi:hypothetical protein